MMSSNLPFARASNRPMMQKERKNQIAAHGAARCSVFHLEHFFVGADHHVVSIRDLADFRFDDDGVFPPVRSDRMRLSSVVLPHPDSR